MEPFSFSELLNTLDKPGSSKHKKSLIQSTTANDTLTCFQITQVIEKLNFSKDKLPILEHLFPKVSDQENLFQIMELFDFGPDQKKAKTLLGQPKDIETALKSKSVASSQNANLQQDAMKNSSFSALLDALGEQKFPKDQLYLVEVAVFRNTFTSTQVVQLLEKFNFPRYKLKALKILRYQIIDPENHFLLLKVFKHGLNKKRASALLNDEENE